MMVSIDILNKYVENIALVKIQSVFGVELWCRAAMMTGKEFFTLLLQTANELHFTPLNNLQDNYDSGFIYLFFFDSSDVIEYLPSTPFLNQLMGLQLNISMFPLDEHFLAMYATDSIQTKRLVIKSSRYCLPEKSHLLIALIKGSLFYPFINLSYSVASFSSLPNELIAHLASYLSAPSLIHLLSSNKLIQSLLSDYHQLWIPHIERLAALLLHEFNATMTPTQYNLATYRECFSTLKRSREAFEIFRLSLPTYRSPWNSPQYLFSPPPLNPPISLPSASPPPGSSEDIRRLVPRSFLDPYP